MVWLFVNRYIDKGRNPQLYTKDCIEKALHKNEQIKGKIDGFKKFKANVLSNFGQTFPNELAKYRALRSNNYSSSNVSTLPTTISGQNPQLQNTLGGSNMSIQQLNNVTSMTNIQSCLGSQQNTMNTSPLLCCDNVSDIQQ